MNSIANIPQQSREWMLEEWVKQSLQLETVELKMVSGDASFRRYFRVKSEDQSWVIMDAPPEKEDSHGFVAIAEFWLKQGIPVPALVAVDLDRGFLILSDMGDQLLLGVLNPLAPDEEVGDLYYSKAMRILSHIQSLPVDEGYALPPYDKALLECEMNLFRDWLVDKKLSNSLDDSTTSMLDAVYSSLVDNALSQVQVPVHRDYHSRNLMVIDGSDDGNVESSDIGVIDFQDAVFGPITYDLVSMLRDCYIVWPESSVQHWLEQYYCLVKEQGLLDESFETFQRWFDLMGMQRHLKAAGIFARLSLRDGKHGYLDDIPRTVNYIANVSAKYPEFAAFHTWLTQTLVPQLSRLKNSV